MNECKPLVAGKHLSSIHPEVRTDPKGIGMGGRIIAADRQGLTLVHIFSQPQPFLSLKPAKHPNTWDKKCSR